jgi:hypothetical protein
VEEKRNAYKIYLEKLKGRHRHRWEGNIRMDLREIELEGVNWIHLDHCRDQWEALVKMVMNIQVP